MFKKVSVIVIAVGLLMALTVPSAIAADFPEKDITMICPWSAGGGTDTLARALVKNAKQYFGVNVNVVNKTGGMGAVGMGDGANARADGYTITMITTQLSTYRLMGLADLSYRDYDLLMLLNRSVGVIAVKADAQWKTMQELMDYAKANPGKLTVGHTGAGGAWHLAMASLATENNVEFTYVPFDGAAPSRTALLGGHVDVVPAGVDELLQLYQSGQIRVLAIAAAERNPAMPDVPTYAEAGFPSEPISDWRGLAAPKGTPPEVLGILEKGFKQCFDDQEFKDLAAELAIPLVYKGGKDFTEFLAGMEKTLEPALDAVGLLKPMK
jgi:tripartite-type tricarboxylate transporter receptor subunit TctC